jgi:uncharacterized protein (TIGR00369 family)
MPTVRGSAGGALRFVANIPFVEEVGLELWAAADGQSELRLNIDGGHLNHLAVAHGGVLMTLLDVAMAQAARTLHRAGEPVGPGVTTVEMKTTFMRPALGRLVAKGNVLQRTRSMAYCEARVFDAAGELCAHATGTFKYVRPASASASAPGPAAPAAERTTGD